MTNNTPFIKTILPSSYGYADPLAALIDVHSQGIDSQWLTKRAAAGVFKNINIKPEPGQAYLHLIAMGDADFYGGNRNGDLFLKQSRVVEIPNPKDGRTHFVKIAKGNVETHGSFVTHAKVYKHHINKDPKRAEGDVIKSAHNDVMNRVELIIRVPTDKWADDIEKIASGGSVPFSMSTRVPYDICTECGNKAKNRGEYCEHAKEHMGEITKQGNQIGVINDHMCYFDISRVVVPADRIAYGLLKAAEAGKRVIGGAELAEQFTLFPPREYDLLTEGPSLDKLSALGKLAEIEKQIEALADGQSLDNRESLDNQRLAFDPEAYDEDMNDSEACDTQVPRGETSDLLGAMADAKICLSLKDFMKIIMGKRFPEVAEHLGDAEDQLPGIFGRLAETNCAQMPSGDDMDLGDGVIPRKAREAIHSMMPAHSLDDDPTSRRMTITILRGKGPVELKKASALVKKNNETSKIAGRLATAYAAYKVAFCQRVGLDDRSLLARVVMQNYI